MGASAFQDILLSTINASLAQLEQSMILLLKDASELVDPMKSTLFLETNAFVETDSILLVIYVQNARLKLTTIKLPGHAFEFVDKIKFSSIINVFVQWIIT